MIKEFGRIGEKQARLFVLKNKNGMQVSVTDLGANWVTAQITDRRGIERDVVLGYDSPKDYLDGEEAIGAIVGRVANRTKGALYVLNGKECRLSPNKGIHNLHSGPEVYQKRMWDVVEADDTHVQFALESPDGDQGHSGAMSVKVTYTLTDENELQIRYMADAVDDVVFNMTNHAYFNLNGHQSGNILGHTMWINGDFYTRTDEDSIPTGEIIPVDGTPLDFRCPKKVGKEIECDYEALVLGNGYDHNWCINGSGYRKAASLVGDESGITMEVYTDRPGVQVYAGNYLKDIEGKDGAVYQKRHGICFETQNYPDAIHNENFPSPVIKAGTVFTTTTAYRFLV